MKYIFSVIVAFILVSFTQDAEARWLLRGRYVSSYGPTYCYPHYQPSCKGYVVSPPVVVDQKAAQKAQKAVQKQAPSFQDLPKKVDNSSKVKESTVNSPVIRAPAPSFQDLPK